MPEKSKRISLASRPHGRPESKDFQYDEVSVPEPRENQVLLKSIYLSVDPYMRGRMSDAKSYVEPFKLGEPINGGVISKVAKSNSKRFNEGDYVIGMLPWQEYSAASEKEIRKVDASIAPLSSYLGILGLTGLTAYFGLMDIGQPKEGETVVISGAAGAVGSAAGQIAKIKGAYVVGIAGTDEKVEYLTKKLGFNKAINYKTCGNIREALKEACPKGIDVYFENVGGEIGDAALSLLNKFARVPVCGAISAYNNTEADIGNRVQTVLIKSSALMKGFVVNDYANRFKEGSSQLGQWLSEGKLSYEETITEGFESIPEAFLGLFQGNNLGKQLVKVSDPE
ncbi:MAG: NADP-dependent oxidoreductase [Bacillota bacterium]